jgi:nitroreductase
MVIDLLSRRASVRSFKPDPVPEDVLQRILEAGRLSPSGGNEQPWRFGVVTDPERIARIAEVACGQAWVAAAPLLIVLCTVGVCDERGGRDIQCARFPEYAGQIRNMDQDLYWALNMEEHQTKIAGAHMVLAALEQGVGCCWVSHFEVHTLARLLELPAHVLPSEILAMGYPAGTPKAKSKKEMGEVVFYSPKTKSRQDIQDERDIQDI